MKEFNKYFIIGTNSDALHDTMNGTVIGELKRGKWIRQTDTRFGEMLNDILICSECKVAFSTVSMIRRSYCPNCGARMEE